MREEFARQYGNLEQWHWWFRGRQRVIEALLDRKLPRVEFRNILSAGCGPADGLGWLLRYAGPRGHVLGADIEPRHAPQDNGRIEFIVSSLNAVPLASAAFDLVLALDVLEHLDDDRGALLEAVRLVRPGGLLVITVPALPSLWGGQDVVSEHRRRYTRGTLVTLFQKAGLAGVEVRYFNTLLFPLAAAVRWSRRALGLSNRPRSDFEDNRPGVMNEVLARVFGAERHVIDRLPLPIGVSLLATYERAPQ